MKITCSRARQLKIAVFIYSLVRGSRLDHYARENSWSRIRESRSSCLVYGKGAISSLQPCYIWEFGGFLCLTFLLSQKVTYLFCDELNIDSRAYK